MIYPITEIFASLQGEGHFVGYPMVFVRLAGCGVTNCHIRAECDEAPWRAKERLTETQVSDRASALRPGGIVCVTGGEPTDHDLLPLIARLREADFAVHLETSGVRPVTGYPLEWLTVSPKRRELAQRTGHALKVVIRPEWDENEAWDFVNAVDKETQFFHRYMQPLTVDGVAVNTASVVSLLMGPRNRDGRWALSCQAHKHWCIP